MLCVFISVLFFFCFSFFLSVCLYLSVCRSFVSVLVAWVFLCWLMLYLIWVRSSCAVIFMALISVCFTVVVTISACVAMYFAVCYNTVGLGDGAIGHCMFGAWGF